MEVGLNSLSLSILLARLRAHTYAPTPTRARTQAARAFLAAVNQDRVAACDSPLAWNDAVKFVVARKFDTNKALELFQNYCRTRYMQKLCYYNPNLMLSLIWEFCPHLSRRF